MIEEEKYTTKLIFFRCIYNYSSIHSKTTNCWCLLKSEKNKIRRNPTIVAQQSFISLFDLLRSFITKRFITAEEFWEDCLSIFGPIYNVRRVLSSIWWMATPRLLKDFLLLVISAILGYYCGPIIADITAFWLIM